MTLILSCNRPQYGSHRSKQQLLNTTNKISNCFFFTIPHSLHTNSTQSQYPHFQVIFFSAARGSSTENLSIPGATQENPEPIALHPKPLFLDLHQKQKDSKITSYTHPVSLILELNEKQKR